MTKFIRCHTANGMTIYVNPHYVLSFQYMSGGLSKLFLAAGPDEFLLMSDSEAASVAHQLQELGLIECD